MTKFDPFFKKAFEYMQPKFDIFINKWPLAIGGGHDINRLRYTRQLDIDDSNIIQ